MINHPVIKGLAITSGLILIWAGITYVTAVPDFMLPSPWRVAQALWTHHELLFYHTMVTALEMLLGLIIGVALGLGTALVMTFWPRTESWMMPILVISQALPVFAIAPLLVLWLGYGLTSKVTMAALIIYFPVTVAMHQGFSHVPKAWRDQAHLMTGRRAPTLNHLRLLFLPAALPTIAAGLRVAAAVVPIGAVVGEWVGSSAGLGHLMLLSNAKMQTDIMFAALFILACLGVLLYASVDRLMTHLTRHHKHH